MARMAPLLAVAWATASTGAEPPNGADQVRIDTIVVTATRIEQPVAETGSTVRIIDAEDIAALGFSQVLGCYRRRAGRHRQSERLFRRRRQRARSRRAQRPDACVMIDGVSVNDASAPGGGFNFARLDTENIERIEILSGPKSTLWGSDAIGRGGFHYHQAPGRRSRRQPFCPGWIVRCYSRRGIGQPRRPCRRLPARGPPGWTTDGISRADERNGNSEEDGFETLTLSTPGRRQPCPGGARIEGSLLWNDADAEFDSFRFGAQGNVGDGDEVSRTEEFSGHLALKMPTLRRASRTTSCSSVALRSTARTSAMGRQSFEAQGERTLFRYQGTLAVNARECPWWLAPSGRSHPRAATTVRSTACSPSTNGSPQSR